MATVTEKSCDSQLSSEELCPNSEWPLSELTDYAKTEHASIQQEEESLATSYWRLGYALTLAKRHFGRGQWGKYLAEQGIDKTRSSRAMAIYRTFPGMEGLAGKSVDAAYKERKRKKKSNRGKSQDDSDSGLEDKDTNETSDERPDTLQTFLVRLRQDSEHWVHEAAFAPQCEIAELIDLAEQAMSALQEIHCSLQEQSEVT